MMRVAKILPGTGRGTATRSGVVEGADSSAAERWAPSTMLRMVPLPVPGRSYFTRVHLRDSQMKNTQPVTRSEPSGLSWRVDL